MSNTKEILSEKFVIGFKKIHAFPKKDSIVSIDSKLIVDHIKMLNSKREKHLSQLYPIWNIHNLTLRSLIDNYQLTYEIPPSDYEIDNGLSSSKCAVKVADIVHNENSKDTFYEIDLSKLYSFPDDVDLDERNMIVSEYEIDEIEIVLLDEKFTLADEIKIGEFGHFDKKSNRFKIFQISQQEKVKMSEPQYAFSSETGMKEFAILMAQAEVTPKSKVFDPFIFEDESLTEQFKKITQDIENADMESVLSDDVIDRIIDKDFMKVFKEDIKVADSFEDDFCFQVDSTPELYINPLSNFMKLLYNEALDTYKATSKEKNFKKFKKELTARYLVLLSNSEFDITTKFK